MKFTDEELRKAAQLAEQHLMDQLPSKEECKHDFSPEFEAKMAQLIDDVKHDRIKQVRARIGWQIYARRGCAAVLVCFLVTFVAMPDAVIAGCQRVIEVVETIFHEYTDYRYKSNVSSETEFHPLKLSYLPEGMEETKKQKGANRIDLFYENKEKALFLNIVQTLFIETADMIYDVDSEDAELEMITIKNEEVNLFFKEDKIRIIWVHGVYKIDGRTNLSRQELITVLEHIEFPED